MYRPLEANKSQGMPFFFYFPTRAVSARYGSAVALTPMVGRIPEAEEVRVWCLEKFGKCHGSGRRWRNGTPLQFYIRHEHDAFEFRLRWC